MGGMIVAEEINMSEGNAGGGDGDRKKRVQRFAMPRYRVEKVYSRSVGMDAG